MKNVREALGHANLTMADISARYTVALRPPIEVSAPFSANNAGISYDTETGRQLREARERNADQEAALWGAIYEQGKLLESKLEQPVRFPTLPQSLTTETYERATHEGLTLRSVPVFPVDSESALQRTIEGENSSSITTVFPRPYIERVLERQIPVPGPEGRHILLDSPDASTPLAKTIGIKDLSKASVAETNEAIRNKGKGALADLGITDPQAKLRIVTARELLLDRALKPSKTEEVTHTTIRGTDRHLSVNGRALHEVSRTERKYPPRLVVAFERHSERWLGSPKQAA